MAYRTINQVPEGTPEIDQMLEAVLLQALDIAREKLDAKEELVPFTALAVGETLFIETHPSENPEDCFKMAQHTVQNARGALAYAFCYDGYVDTNEGELDCIIAEGGMPGEGSGHAAGILYTVEGEGDELEFRLEEQPIYIGEAPNFMAFTLVIEDDDTSEDDDDAEDDDAQDGVDGDREDIDDENDKGDDDDASEDNDDNEDKYGESEED